MPLKIPPPYVSLLPKILAGESISSGAPYCDHFKKRGGKNWLEKTKTHQKVVVQEAKKRDGGS